MSKSQQQQIQTLVDRAISSIYKGKGGPQFSIIVTEDPEAVRDQIERAMGGDRQTIQITINVADTEDEVVAALSKAIGIEFDGDIAEQVDHITDMIHDRDLDTLVCLIVWGADNLNFETLGVIHFIMSGGFIPTILVGTPLLDLEMIRGRGIRDQLVI